GQRRPQHGRGPDWRAAWPVPPGRAAQRGGRHARGMSNRRIDSEFQRRIVIGLKGRILEAQQALLGMAQKFLAGRTGADVVCLPPGRELGAPLPEALCAREWGEVVRPDGYGIWTEADISIPFLLEYDNGTERLERLAGKLDGYARLAAAAG